MLTILNRSTFRYFKRRTIFLTTTSVQCIEIVAIVTEEEKTRNSILLRELTF